MAYDFPASPFTGQVFQGYTYDGEKWISTYTANLLGAVRYDLPQGLTTSQMAQGRANISVTKKNYIVNGGMQVSQENGTTTGSITAAVYYPVDQFFGYASTSAAVNTAQQTTGIATPGGSSGRIYVTATTADATVGAGDICYVAQRLEGLRVADLMFGTAAAKTVTIQFGVSAPAGTYCVTLANAAENRAYVAEYVISAGEANTSVIKSVTIPGDTTGTWPRDNTLCMTIRWGLMAGTTYQQAAGSWGTTANVTGSASQFNLLGTINNTFVLFDVSLTEGSVAPPFQVPDYASELALCKRYYFKTYDQSIAPGTVRAAGAGGIMLSGAPAASTMGGHLTYPVALRASATVTIYSNSGVANSASYYTGTWNNGGVVTINNPGNTSINFTAVTSGVAMLYNFDVVANARL